MPVLMDVKLVDNIYDRVARLTALMETSHWEQDADRLSLFISLSATLQSNNSVGRQIYELEILI